MQTTDSVAMDLVLMAAINVDKMSLKELVALQVRLENAIAEARRRERIEVRRRSRLSPLALASRFLSCSALAEV